MKRLVLWKTVVIASLTLLPFIAFANKPPDDLQKEKILKQTYRVSVPFIENRGQVENEDICFYAKTFGGTLFVGKDGTLTYSLLFEDNGGVVIKEVFTNKEMKIEGLDPSPTRVNYFKGNDKSKWRSNIPSYGSVSLGEIYKGIELKLRAYGNNVEKLFTVLPGENPDKIRIKLEGSKGLKINAKGELEVNTEHGPIKFTKPLAYQEINGKKVEIDIEYKIQASEVRSQESEDKSQGSEVRNQKSEHKDDINSIPQSEIRNPKSAIKSPTSHIPYHIYSFKIGTYDKSKALTIDPLLSSTFIGGGG